MYGTLLNSFVLPDEEVLAMPQKLTHLFPKVTLFKYPKVFCVSYNATWC